MNLSVAVCGTVVACMMLAACSSAPSPRTEPAGPEAAEPEPEAALPDTAQEQEAPGAIQAEPVPVPPGARHENLTCITGTEDRQARIGVELINDQVAYFAFYSKWRPRTCSLEAGRGDAFSRWSGDGAHFTVTLAEQKGELRIERNGGTIRFGFFDVDRVRYCGMPGKINGTLTVTRGKESCVVEGIMDGHAM